MRLRLLHGLTPAILLAAACVAPADDGSRKHVARALTRTLGEAGEAADPQIAFRQDSTHLLVQFLTVAFPTVSDGELTSQATRIAKTALSNYDRADQLDSVTVLYREPVRKGTWWIRHTRSFSVDSLHAGTGSELGRRD